MANHIEHVLELFLCKEFKTIDIYYQSQRETESIIAQPAPIWVMWLQNIENAPFIVQKCIESIKENAGKHPVILITEENLSSYIALPAYILEKHDKKYISNAHFSDIVRVALLQKYGGIWIDATIFLSAALPESIFAMPYFSGCKSKEKTEFIPSHGQWTGNFMGSNRKSSFVFSYLYECLLCYWKKYDELINYHLIDYLIMHAYHTFSLIAQYIDETPVNNTERHMLYNLLNQTYNEETEKVITKIFHNTYCHKLTYKKTLHTFSADGNKTVYHVLFYNRFNKRENS